MRKVTSFDEAAKAINDTVEDRTWRDRWNLNDQPERRAGESFHISLAPADHCLHKSLDHLTRIPGRLI